MNRLLSLSLLVVAAVLPGTAFAEGTVLGARVAYLRGLEAEGANHFGGGLSIEQTLIAHRLEAELVAQMMPAAHELRMPVELLLKVPFHVNEWLQPYLGLGPAMGLGFGEEGTTVHFGGAGVVGSYFWFSESVGALFELNYEGLYEAELVHEAGVTAGLAWRF